MGLRVRFAVSREDATIEAELVRRLQARTILVMAGGGCTALSLQREFPAAEVVAFDRDPAQLAHLREKIEAASRGDGYALSVGDATVRRLNQRGAVEGLFRVLRHFLLEFVLHERDLETFFLPDTSAEARARACDGWFASAYWPTAFDVAFEAACVQQVTGGPPPAGVSVPRHFQRRFEARLRDEGAGRNHFLQHVFLGCYYDADAPLYARTSGPLAVKLIEGDLADVPDLQRFDLICLSDALDWVNDVRAQRWAAALQAARPGSALLLRQLSGKGGLQSFFASAFTFDDGQGAELAQLDKALVHERIDVARRT